MCWSNLKKVGHLQVIFMRLQRISEGLEQQFLSDKPQMNHTGMNGDGGLESEENPSPVPSSPQGKTLSTFILFVGKSGRVRQREGKVQS